MPSGSSSAQAGALGAMRHSSRSFSVSAPTSGRKQPATRIVAKAIDAANQYCALVVLIRSTLCCAVASAVFMSHGRLRSHGVEQERRASARDTALVYRPFA